MRCLKRVRSERITSDVRSCGLLVFVNTAREERDLRSYWWWNEVTLVPRRWCIVLSWKGGGDWEEGRRREKGGEGEGKREETREGGKVGDTREGRIKSRRERGEWKEGWEGRERRRVKRRGESWKWGEGREGRGVGMGPVTHLLIYMFIRYWAACVNFRRCSARIQSLLQPQSFFLHWSTRSLMMLICCYKL